MLAEFPKLKDDLPDLILECGQGGALIEEMDQFLRSLGGRLKRKFGLYGWQHHFEKEDPDEDGASYVQLRLFPGNWILPSEYGEISLNVTWYNPFITVAADRQLSVEVQVPDQWPHFEDLRELIRPQLSAEAFTDIYPDGEALASVPFWKYVPLEPFVGERGFDVPRYVDAIAQAFSALLEVRAAIDKFVAQCGPFSHMRQEIRDLQVVAFLDTETTGQQPSAEVIELAIVTAACDPITGQVLGVLDQYVGHRQPKAEGVESRCREVGLTPEFLRGKDLDECRIRELLKEDTWIVAHNAAFDRGALKLLYPWVEALRWKCSLNEVEWNRDEGRGLQDLMRKYQIQTEEAHRALPDALALLQLMSRRDSGKTFLAQLLGW
jgi:hypothetical protein